MTKILCALGWADTSSALDKCNLSTPKVLKYCFPILVISDKDIAPQTVFYSSQTTYNCYLLPNGVTEQSRWQASGMLSPLACIADNIEQNSSYIHKMAI